MASERRVQLVPQGQAVSGQGYRLVIDATNANLMDPAFFVLRRSIINYGTGETRDFFDHIASPEELNSLPVDDPTEDSENLFRTDRLDQIWVTQAIADEVWTSIVSEVGLLKNALDAADRLEELGAVWVGSPPP